MSSIAPHAFAKWKAKKGGKLEIYEKCSADFALLNFNNHWRQDGARVVERQMLCSPVNLHLLVVLSKVAASRHETVCIQSAFDSIQVGSKVTTCPSDTYNIQCMESIQENLVVQALPVLYASLASTCHSKNCVKQ